MMPGAMTDTPRTPPDATALPLADAAVRLGISPDAARKRLERGTLIGYKLAGRWYVHMSPDAMASTDQDAGLSGQPDSDRTADATRTPVDAAPDIAPLAELLADVTRRNEELAAAAALWQYRAMQAEERLAQLEVGPIAGDVEDSAQVAHREPTPHERREAFWHTPAEPPSALRVLIRRLIGR
jgi:hypothetical protein